MTQPYRPATTSLGGANRNRTLDALGLVGGRCIVHVALGGLEVAVAESRLDRRDRLPRPRHRRAKRVEQVVEAEAHVEAGHRERRAVPTHHRRAGDRSPVSGSAKTESCGRVHADPARSSWAWCARRVPARPQRSNGVRVLERAHTGGIEVDVLPEQLAQLTLA